MNNWSFFHETNTNNNGFVGWPLESGTDSPFSNSSNSVKSESPESLEFAQRRSYTKKGESETKTDEYRRKRASNREAVAKCRRLKREKEKKVLEEADTLRKRVRELEGKVEQLEKQLQGANLQLQQRSAAASGQVMYLNKGQDTLLNGMTNYMAYANNNGHNQF